jgi:multisubunit Na+/H+ antiporter MnhB subunit
MSESPLGGRSRTRRLLPIVGGLLVMAIYLVIAWFVLPPDAFSTPDEGIKLLQTESLRLEDGRLLFDIVYHGQEIDPDLRHAPQRLAWGLQAVPSGLRFRRVPLFPLLTWLPFRWFGDYGLYLLPAFGAAASGLLALHLLERKDRRPAMWLLIAFGSPILIYGVLFWEHTPATCLGLAGTWLALRVGLRAGHGRLAWWLAWTAVGIALGASLFLRLEMIVFDLALVAACWFVMRENRWGPVWALVVVGLMLLLYVQLHVTLFGQPLPDNAHYLFYPFLYLSKAGWRAVPDLLVGPYAEGALDTGWLGGLWAIAAVVVLAHSFTGTASPAARSVRWIGLAITAVIGALFLFTDTSYYSAHGLLFTTPWALLGLARAREVWQRGGHRARVVVLTAVLGLIGYAVGMIVLRADSPHGGLEWGARFALTFYPLLALIAAWDLGPERRDGKILLVVGALVFLGLGFQMRGVWAIRQGKEVNEELNRTIVDIPEQHVVFSQWWLPINAAPIYSQKVFFVAEAAEELAAWVELASTHGVQRFVLVTADVTLPGGTDELLDGYRLEILEAREISRQWVFWVSIRLV